MSHVSYVELGPESVQVSGEPEPAGGRGDDRVSSSIDPRKLLYFASIVDHGSFNKAAKQLLISQPALSTSIDRFEQSVGMRLLERSSTGVTPTPLGEALYAHARLIREELERAEKRLKPATGRRDDVLSIGTLPSLATSIVPAAVARWRVDHPTTILRVVEKNQIELLLALLRGEADFIVAQTEFYGFLEGMRQRVLFRDRLHIMARKGHPALRHNAPNWAYLASFPWVVQMVGRQRMLLEKLLAVGELDLPSQLTESGSVDFIKALVTETNSLAMLPAAAVSEEVRSGTMQPLDITEPLLDRDIAVLFREGATLTDASRALLNQIEAIGIRRSQEPNELLRAVAA